MRSVCELMNKLQSTRNKKYIYGTKMMKKNRKEEYRLRLVLLSVSCAKENWPKLSGLFTCFVEMTTTTNRRLFLFSIWKIPLMLESSIHTYSHVNKSVYTNTIRREKKLYYKRVYFMFFASYVSPFFLILLTNFSFRFRILFGVLLNILLALLLLSFLSGISSNAISAYTLIHTHT